MQVWGKQAAVLLGLTLLAATCICATTTLPREKRAQGRDALHVLFGGSAQGGRSLLPRPSSGISYETVRVVEHPTRSDMQQKKVQQSHAGLQLFGHTFVVGLAADGVTEQADGTYGTVFTYLEKALPDTTPTLTPAAAAAVAQSVFESGTVASTRLVIWIEKESSYSVHLAYVVALTGSSSSSSSSSSAAPAPAYVLVDAKDGRILRAWREQRTQHVPRPRQQYDSTTETTKPLHPTAAQTLPQSTPTALPSSADNRHVRRGLRQSKYLNIWAIGGNEKVGRIYYNGSNRHPELQVTRSGRNCFFSSQYVKTGDVLQVFTRQQWAKGAIEDYASETGSAWASGNISRVHEYYDAFPAVGYLCPKQGEYLATTDQVRGAYSQQADIQAIMSVIFNMWKSWLGVDVIAQFKAAGLPTPVLVVPHAQPEYDNAYWASWFFACGDGNETFYPLCTGGDVLAHELAHGVTQIINSDLLYFGQAGAWNEAFSDMVGMTYTFFDTGRVDPLIGADIMRGNASALRNMSDPAQFSQSSNASSLTTADPHLLSGVPNLAFYLLATSPCYDPKLAMLVAQRAANLYFTPSISFEDGANAWARAAKDLGFNASAVNEAWESVGLWQSCGRRVVETVSGYFSDPSVPADDPLASYFHGAANASVYVGNITYEDLNYNGLRPCGISFSLASFDYSLVLPNKNSRPSIYVGVNRVPDPLGDSESWDCRVDMEGSASGPSQPACDLPATPNTTYHVVALSSRSWALQGFLVTGWGPRAGVDATDEPAAAPKCFNGGVCTGDSACTSGYCLLGYCAKKPRAGAVKRAHMR